jgi:hypothetical protein
VLRATSIAAASLSTPSTAEAVSRRIAEPYPLPQARSITRRPPQILAANR